MIDYEASAQNFFNNGTDEEKQHARYLSTQIDETKGLLRKGKVTWYEYFFPAKYTVYKDKQ